jgi:Transposase DDE domain
MNTGKTLFAQLIDFLPRKTLAGKQHYPERLRRIRFRDAETGKMLVFLTNNFDLPELTIAALYKNRWQVEMDQAAPFGSSSSMGPRKTRSRPRYGSLCQSMCSWRSSKSGSAWTRRSTH